MGVETLPSMSMALTLGVGISQRRDVVISTPLVQKGTGTRLHYFALNVTIKKEIWGSGFYSSVNYAN